MQFYTNTNRLWTLVLLSLFAILPGKTNSQGPTFERHFGNSGATNSTIVSVEPCSDGGYVFAGRYDTSPTLKECYLVKTDVDGNPEWSYSMAEQTSLFGRTVVETSGGGYAVCAYDVDRVFLIRFDASGNILWQKKYRNSSGNPVQALEMIETSDNGFAMTGFLDTGTDEVIVLKVNSSGDVQWSKAMPAGQNQDYKGVAIAESQGGDLWVLGDRSTDYMLLRLSSTGVLLDARLKYPTPTSGLHAVDLEIMNNGQVIVAGYNSSMLALWMEKVDHGMNTVARGPYTFSSLFELFDIEKAGSSDSDGFVIAGVDYYDMFIAKFDSNLTNTRWVRIGDSGTPSPVSETANDLEVVPGGGLIVGGHEAASPGAVLLRTDDDYLSGCNETVISPHSKNMFPTSPDSIWAGSAIDGQIVAETANLTLTTVGIDTIICQVVGVETGLGKGLDLQVYPHPVEDRSIIEFNSDSFDPVSIELLDLHGRALRTLQPEQGRAIVDRGDLPAGIYILRIDFDSAPSVARKIQLN